MNRTCSRSARWAMVVIGVAVLVAFAQTRSAAQGVARSSVVGTITDETNSAVPGATVTLVNPETGIRDTVHADDAGNYVIPNVLVGDYMIEVEADGFSKAIVRDVRVRVGTTYRANAQLAIGPLAAEVTVTAKSPLLQTETSDVSTVVERKRIVDLPLVGRDFQQLQLLTPGAVDTMSFQNSDVSGLGGGASAVSTNNTMIASNGARPGSQLFLVDGANNTNRQGRTIVLAPIVDEIEEFRISGANFSAETGYGTNAISVATRSGTNRFRGAGWEFFRHDKLNARNFFAFSPPKLVRNQFGGTIGGPILRNQTFFLVSYEGVDETSSRPWLSTVPTARMRSGDLSELGVPIYDPLTSRYVCPQGQASCADVVKVIERDPFPGNVIPADRLDPVSQLFLEWYPMPNREGRTANFYNDPPFGTASHQYSTRIDHRFSGRDTLMGRFSRRLDKTPQQGPYEGHSKDDYNPGVIGVDLRSTNVVLAWTHQFSPSTSLEVRPSYSRPDINQFSGPNIGIDWTSRAGIQGFGPGVSDVFPTWPHFDISGMSPIHSYIGFRVVHNSRDIATVLTKVAGRHMLKFGNTFASYQQALYIAGLGQGQFAYGGGYTSNPAAGGGGAGVADYLLGYPSSGSRYVPPGTFYIQLRNNWSFIQDDWKVTDRLTLNLGMRYELNFPTTEKYDQLATWVPTARDGRGAIVIPNREAVTGERGQLHSSVERSLPTYMPLSVFAGDIGLPERSMRFLNKTQFAPRLGLAYRLGDDVVVRGGYGVFYNQLDGNRETEFLSPPFLIRELGINNALTADGAPARTTRTFFPAGSTFSSRPVVFGHDPYVDNFGTTQQWNVFVQRLLPWSTAVEVGYVGSKAEGLQNARAINTPLPGPGSIDTRRPYPDFLGITWSEQKGSASYHGLQMKAERRYHNGLTFMSSFTWSKAIDDSSSSSAGCLNPYDCAGERAVSAFDVPFTWVTSWVYDLPFWRDSGHWAVRSILGGWTFSGIYTARSGLPFSVYWAGDAPNTGQGSRPNAGSCSGVLDNPTVERWFDASCFTAPAQYTYGNVGRNTLRADGVQNLDLGIHKNVAVGERQRLQVRVEMFNALNHPNFGVPARVVNANGAGVVTSAGPARIIQLAVKYYFD